ncbi:MAG: methyltransferase [Verrucomicrobia bacterium]|nr:methyltransferase [Verrucomicrobiota bacterium]
MNELRQLLAQSGYLQFHLAFGEGNLTYKEWKARAPGLPDPLCSLVELFLLGGCLPAARAKRLLGPAIFRRLCHEGILRLDKGTVATDRFLLISFHSLIFFCENLSDPSVYFGTDSIALGSYQSPVPGGVTLDLCAGSGIQAMVAALQARRSYAVEINPRAARLARFNVALNGLDRKVRVFNRSLDDFRPPNKLQFDLITFNPPLLPVPKSLRYPFVGDGGSDGLCLTRRVLERYLPMLTPSGAIEFVGCALGRDGDFGFVRSLDRICRAHGAGGRVNILGKARLRPGAPFYDCFVHTLAAYNGLPTTLCHQVCAVQWEQLKVNETYLFFARVDRRPPTRGLRTLDLSGPACHWFLSTPIVIK